MSVSEAIEITTKDCNCNLWLPNIFTPYSNGISYVYLPVTTSEFYSFSMTIYNRWGMEVFRTNKFIGWDGKSRGQDVPAGVYFCVIRHVGSAVLFGSEKDRALPTTMAKFESDE